MTINSWDKLVAALEGSQKLPFTKLSATAEGAGTWHSLWAVAGNPVAGVAQGSVNGAIPTRLTTGAFSFSNPVTGASHVGRFIVVSTTAGQAILYDRLWHNSGLVGNVTTSQSVSPPALTRYTSGDGLQLWGEIYTAIGATASTLTVSYTNQAGTSGRSATYAHPANAESVGQMFPLTFQAGDTGIRSVQSAQWSPSTGTAGNFGLTLVKPLFRAPMGLVNDGKIYDLFQTGLARIVDDACLSLMVQCTATNTGIIHGELDIIQG